MRALAGIMTAIRRECLWIKDITMIEWILVGLSGGVIVLLLFSLTLARSDQLDYIRTHNCVEIDRSPRSPIYYSHSDGDDVITFPIDQPDRVVYRCPDGRVIEM